MDYYDCILGLIPLAMGGIAALLSVLGVSTSLAVPAGAAAALPLVTHALFVRAPTGATPEATTVEPEQTTTARQTGHTNTAD